MNYRAPTVPLVEDAAAQAILRRHNVRVLGTGQPVVFCNGFSCSQQVWHLLTPHLLTGQHQLVFFDQIGAGQSDPSAYNAQHHATLAGYAQDVVAICQALQVREVVLVGHSSGAMVALLAAVQAPNYVACTVLLATSPCFLNEPGYYGGFERADLLQFLAEMHTNYAQWLNTFATMLIGQHKAAALSHELAECLAQSDLRLGQHLIELTFLSDFRWQLPHLRTPTLLLQCTDDPAVPVEVSAYLLAHLPHATLVTLATASHSPQLTAPREVALAIKQFLKRG